VVLGVLILSLLATLIGRLWYLQVIAAPQYRVAAFQNQVRDVVTQAPRGEIVDDKGRPWVTNKTAVVITVDRSALDQQADEGKAVLHRLAGLLNTSYQLLHAETKICRYPKRKVKIHGKTVTRRVALPAHCYVGDPTQPIPVSQAKPTTSATRRAIHIQEMPELFPGVDAQTTAVRHYPRPLGAMASTMLGYTAPIDQAALDQMSPARQDVYRNSRVGLTGLEEFYNKQLRGKPGVKQITVDHLGNPTGVVKNTSPRQGNDLVTYLDAKAQADLEQQVQTAIDNARNSGQTADYAAGVVLNARNGGIVAMASLPTYNPNRPPPTLTKIQYKRISNQLGNPFLDKAFGSANPPGSTFKPIAASGLIWDGTMAPGPAYDCPTNFQNRQNFEGGSGKGFISLHEALVISCDTFFFKLGYTDWLRDQALIKQHKKPREGVQHIARAYGYGENPKIDLPGAQYGHIADRYNTRLNWRANHQAACDRVAAGKESSYLQALDRNYCKSGYIFYPGDQENQDVGQGTVLASPLQVAVAYAAIANGGTVFEPRIVKAILSPSGKLIKRVKAPVRDHLPLSASALDYIRSALYGVVNEPSGTAHGTFAGFPTGSYPIGGKTGTAELTGTDQNGTWFASFGGPSGQKPQYVTVIEVDKAEQGALSSAPYVKAMWEYMYGVGGRSPIFKNGIPPATLPKVGAAAIKERIAKRQHRQKVHRRQLRQQQNSGTSPTTSPTSASGTSPP
jgi:penicillin-binding protein 2